MKVSKKYIFILNCLIIIFIIFIINCKGPEFENEETEEPEIPIITVQWKPDINNYIQFYTNDTKLLTIDGSSFWKWGSFYENQMTSFEAELIKVSGVNYYGYGLIFCIQDDAGNGMTNGLIVMIDTVRQYIIGKVVNNDFYVIKDWTITDALISGYNIKNKIKINYLGNNNFEVIFNDNNTSEKKVIFEYDQEPGLNLCGRYGYIVTLSPYELFPKHPVDVRFKQITPLNIDIKNSKSEGVNYNFFKSLKTTK